MFISRSCAVSNKVVSPSLLDSRTDTASRSTYTFTGLTLGSGRVLVGLCYNIPNSGGSTGAVDALSSVVLGGVAAVEDSNTSFQPDTQFGDDRVGWRLFLADMSGATGNLVVSFSKAAKYCTAVLFSAGGVGATTGGTASDNTVTENNSVSPSAGNTVRPEYSASVLFWVVTNTSNAVTVSSPWQQVLRVSYNSTTKCGVDIYPGRAPTPTSAVVSYGAVFSRASARVLILRPL